MKRGDVYRKAAELVLTQRYPLFYSTISEVCGRSASYTKYRRPAVRYFMGEAYGTPEEFAMAYLLLAAIVEAPGGAEELAAPADDE